MSDISYVRQLGFFNPTEHPDAHVHIIGLGGIGSFVALGVGKLGVPHMTIVDPDVVDGHNVPNQMHAHMYVDSYTKVWSTSVLLDEYADVAVNSMVGRFTSNGYVPDPSDDCPIEWRPKDIVISGLDSMEARRDVWEAGAIKLNPAVKLYVDARIAGQLIVVYAVNPTNLAQCDAYEKTLHSDEEAEPAPCTERGVIDVGLMVAGLVTRMVRMHYTGGDVPRQTVLNQATLSLLSGEWN